MPQQTPQIDPFDCHGLDDGGMEEVALEYLNKVKTGLEGIAHREAVNHPIALQPRQHRSN